jgi:AraC-like DNA-binding protein
MDPRRPIAPFIYFIRRVRAGKHPFDLTDESGMRCLYGIWRQRDGITTLTREGQSVDLHPGDCGLCEPGMGALAHPRSRATYCAFSLEPRIRQVRIHGEITINNTQPPEPSWRDLFGRTLPALVPAEAVEQIRDLVDEEELLYWRGPVQRFAGSMRLAAWLFAMAGGEVTQRSDDLLQRFDDLIALRYRSPLTTVASIARELGVSAAHLTRRYRAHRSYAPGEALRRERIAEAKKLLAGTDRPLQEVVSRVGYGDTTAFIRAFKQMVGVPPQRWRRERRAGGRK